MVVVLGRVAGLAKPAWSVVRTGRGLGSHRTTVLAWPCQPSRLPRPAPYRRLAGGYGLGSCSVAAELNYSLIRGWVPPGRGDPARRDPAGTSVLSGRTSHISSDDVGGMPVPAGPRSVVSHRRAGVGV